MIRNKKADEKMDEFFRILLLIAVFVILGVALYFALRKLGVLG